jgi:nucleotide-binding universal stress UspA family protein
MSANADRGPVVVGVDFSKHNAPAVAYAAHEASTRGLPLELLHALDPRDILPTYLALPDQELIDEVESELADQAAAVVSDRPGLDVRTAVVQKSPTDALVDASRRATMVVIGSRGHGTFSQLLLGAVAWRVVSRAHGPIVLVRPSQNIGASGAAETAPVLVGVDGSASSAAAVDFAFAEAQARGTGVVAASVWSLPHPEGLAIGRTWPAEADQWRIDMESDADRILAEALAGKPEQFPDVEITRVVVHGLNIPMTLLEVAAAKDAELVVVGAHGQHALPVLVLGAVGVQLAHHADRSVAVVHDDGTQR